MPLIISPEAAGLPRTPYLTVAEFEAAPTDLDLSELISGGTSQQQTDAIATAILQASSQMDDFVNYVLGATQDTLVGWFKVRRDGYICIPARGKPVLEVDSFSFGITPSNLITLTSAPDAVIDHNVIWMPTWSNGQTSLLYVPFGIGQKVYVQMTYVNGWPNTLLGQTANANATSIVVQSSLGIYPGTQMRIYDSGITETVTVAPTYVGGVGSSTTIPLAAGLASTHQPGVSVSALPPTVKQACVRWTAGLIKTRGGGALEMDTIEEHSPKVDQGEGGGLEDIAMAEAMLQRFVLASY